MVLALRMLRLALCIGVCTAPLGATAAGQAYLADFYHGRSIQLVVGFNPGGGADTYARVIARHIGRYIPGNPTVLVRNMQGAGSLNAANYVYNRSPRDGTELGLFSGHIAIDPLTTQGAYKYDAEKFNWIGAPASEPNVCITSPGSGVRTISDAQLREVILGTTGASGNSTYDFPTLLNGVLRTKFKLVKGYAGSAAMNLAFNRGEIDGFCGVGYDFLRGAGLIGDKSQILVQFGLSKSVYMPTVPFIMDLADSEDQRRIFRLVFGWLDFERSIAMPPDTPVDKVEAVRHAFDMTMRDPEFLADAKKVMVEIGPKRGAEIMDFIHEAYRTPPAIIKKAAEYLGREPPVGNQ